MASGISSPWGFSPPMIAGLTNSLDSGNQHLTGQLSMTSTPVLLGNSPLTIQNKSYYTAFGKKSKMISKLNKEIKFLKSV
jgi:hypothetical protein